MSAAPESPQVSYQLDISSQAGELKRVDQWLSAIAKKQAYSERTQFVLDLVCNEAILNIITHGYQEDPSQSISLRLQQYPDHILVSLQDNAAAFDPLQVPDPEVSRDLEHAHIGGQGVHLIKSYCFDCSYDYVDGQNRLQLQVELS